MYKSMVSIWLSMDKLQVVIAFSSIASALFVGYQAMLFRGALDDPFQANLQNRQIQTCEEFVVANRTWTQTLFPLTEKPFTTPFDDPSKWTEDMKNYDLSSRLDQINHASQQLRTALNKLAVFAGPNLELIDRALDAERLDHAGIVWLLRKNMELSETDLSRASLMEEMRKFHDEYTSRMTAVRAGGFKMQYYRDEAARLEQRCKGLMAGNEPGLF